MGNKLSALGRFSYKYFLKVIIQLFCGEYAGFKIPQILAEFLTEASQNWTALDVSKLHTGFVVEVEEPWGSLRTSRLEYSVYL